MYSCTPASSSRQALEQADAHAAAARGSHPTGSPPAARSVFSSCRMVAWKVRTGTAAMTLCDTFIVSLEAAPSARLACAVTSQRRLSALTGAFTSQPTSCETPGARLSVMGFRSSPPHALCRRPRRRTSPALLRRAAFACVAHGEAWRDRHPARAPAAASRRTASGPAWSGSRVWPVPNRPASPLATATMRNEVSESLSGTSTRRPALLVQLHPRLPEQQGVEQLARGRAARPRRPPRAPCGRSDACPPPAWTRSRCPLRCRAAASWC